MRPTSAIVRLDSISNNYRVASRLAPGSQTIAVIKANAYGHGLLEVAQALQDEVPAFAVAFFDEAVRLRDAGISKPILVLQGATHAADIAEAAASDFWLLLHHRQQVEWVLSSESPGPVKVWLKVETGMHRLGLKPDSLDQVCEDLSTSARVQQGLVLCTQLPTRRESCAGPNPMLNGTGRVTCFMALVRQGYSTALHSAWSRP